MVSVQKYIIYMQIRLNIISLRQRDADVGVGSSETLEPARKLRVPLTLSLCNVRKHPHLIRVTPLACGLSTEIYNIPANSTKNYFVTSAKR